MRLIQFLLLCTTFGFFFALTLADFFLYRIVWYHGAHMGTYFLRAYVFFFFGLCNSLVFTSLIIYLRKAL